jgi:hypothetical protein
VVQWLEVAKLADTTRERYEDLVRIYITPAFGELAASKIDVELLERFYARCSAAGPASSAGLRWTRRRWSCWQSTVGGASSGVPIWAASWTRPPTFSPRRPMARFRGRRGP